MNALLIYLAQSSVCLGMLLGVYWFLLRHDTFFQMNRFFLLLSAVFSLLIPLFPFHRVLAEPASVLVVLLDPVLISPGRIQTAVSGHVSWIEILQVIYFTGVVIFLARYLFRLIQISWIIRSSSMKKADGYRLVSIDKAYSPFSFFNMIFISDSTFTSENRGAILAHEEVHIRQAHTLDLIIAELIIIVQWFNPFAWLMVSELKNIHEYLADDGVIRRGVPAASYQQLILDETLGFRVNNLANNFNISQLKKRIMMMKQKRSGNWAIGKVMMVLPVVVAMGLLFSAGALSSGLSQDKRTVESKKTGVSVVVPDTSKKYVVPDKQPVFPGGDDARRKFFIDNIKYPAEAMKNNVQGKVFVTFNVEIDGTVTGVKVIRGIGAGCDEEAVRVIKLMPKWTPAELKGKPVPSNFVIPIKFALDGDKKGKPKQEEKLTPGPTDTPSGVKKQD